MMTIQKILFPVDFSASCGAMAAFVKRAAAITSAKVTLMYVLEPPASGFELLTRPLPDAEEDRKKVACAKLESYLSAEFPLHDTPRLLVEGEAGARIAKVARDCGFDLIIMPTHACAFRRMLLGSTTAKVLNDADCMVMTTQHAETMLPRPREHREWVCAIGLSAASERVLRIATQVGGDLPREPLTRSCDSCPAAWPTGSIGPRRASAVLGKAGCARPPPRVAKSCGLARSCKYRRRPHKRRADRGSVQVGGRRACHRKKLAARFPGPLARSHLRGSSRRALSGAER